MWRPANPLLFLIGLVGLGLSLIGLLGIDSSQVVLSTIFILSFLCLLDARLSPKRFRDLKITGESTVRLHKNQSGTLSFVITHPEKLPWFRIGIPVSLDLGVQNIIQKIYPRTDSTDSCVSWSLRPTVRGIKNLSEIVVEIPSIFHLGAIRKTYSINCRIEVYADLRFDRGAMASFLQSRGTHGNKLQGFQGQGREFDQLRDYTRGDSMDKIHWKASAKRGNWTTKTFQIERTQEVYAVIDSSHLSRKMHPNPLSPSKRQSALERYIQSATYLSMIVSNNKDKFGLLGYDDKLHTVLKAGNGQVHQRTCQKQFLTLRSSHSLPDYEGIFSRVATQLRRRALLIFLVDLSDPIAGQIFQKALPILSQRHIVHVTAISDPQTQEVFEKKIKVDQVKAIHQALAHHYQWKEQEELKRQFHRLGASLEFLPSEQFTLGMVNHYLSVKRRQLL